MLEVKNLSKRFGKTVACDNVRFRVEKGKFFVLLGPSGCGKTTILRLIAGLEKPDAGQILINNSDVKELDVQKRDVAMVFQNYALYPSMNVRKNLEFPLKMRKVKSQHISETVESTAELLEIKNLLDKKPANLSGGQQQRVAVGRALVRKPHLFLLDEPLSNLDAKLRHHLRVELARIHKQLNMTSVYVTHDQGEAMTLADTIAVIREGKIQQSGPPEEIYSKPANIFVARFIGFPEINIFKARLKNDQSAVEIMGREIKLNQKPNLRKKNILAGVRPEDLRITKSKCVFKASLDVSEDRGADTLLYLNCRGKTLRALVGKEKKHLIPADGKEVSLDLKADNLLFFDSETGELLHLK